MDIKMIKKIVVFCLVFMIISYPAAAEETRPVQITEADVARAIALKEREEAVETREKELSSREQELAAVRKEVDQKLARLVSLQSEVKGQLDELKSIQGKEFKNLTLHTFFAKGKNLSGGGGCLSQRRCDRLSEFGEILRAKAVL